MYITLYTNKIICCASLSSFPVVAIDRTRSLLRSGLARRVSVFTPPKTLLACLAAGKSSDEGTQYENISSGCIYIHMKQLGHHRAVQLSTLSIDLRTSPQLLLSMSTSVPALVIRAIRGRYFSPGDPRPMIYSDSSPTLAGEFVSLLSLLEYEVHTPFHHPGSRPSFYPLRIGSPTQRRASASWTNSLKAEEEILAHRRSQAVRSV